VFQAQLHLSSWLMIIISSQVDAYSNIAKGRLSHSVGASTRFIKDKIEASSRCRFHRVSSLYLNQNLKEPNEYESNFGRQKYWNDFYDEENEFCWYSPWNDISPFFKEILENHLSSNNSEIPRVLLPGIGNDSSMVDMYDEGFTHLAAFDYAEEGVECAKRFFGHRLLSSSESREQHGVDLRVADARNLPYDDTSFDAVLEKGTLDAIYLSGGKDKEMAMQHLSMAVDELTRVVSEGGILFSVTAACADQIESELDLRKDDWVMIRDGSFFTTESGYSSNNVDAMIYAWQRKSKEI